ncbi:LOW QUALITY PROTEIN: proton-coupled folate transporter-like [Dendronephthya gigantea]|uniref:LOW QUALITY PROTEIN: proton-coupled folate transporter-like n=1 Tax=Dendronephthya gigantea TaxID=151771 RepID=UPI00106A3CD0|nr:LOW QUALITY PROTEIN: proton-coupled folate transporter-like [Dendronephthya gigantea]
MRSVTVEPVVFGYVFSAAMLSPLLQQYIYDELSERHNFTITEDSQLCKNGTGDSGNISALENRIQTDASYWFIAQKLSMNVPSLFATLLYGSLSDAVGRKPTMLFATFGALINCLIVSITVTLAWPFYVIFLGAFINGVTGAHGSMLASCLAYIVDITDNKSRSIRMGLIQLSIVLAVMLSFFIGGIWLKNSGYIPPFWSSVGILFFCCLYIKIVLPESLTEKQKFNKFSFLTNARRIKEFVLKKRALYVNVCLLLSFISFTFTVLDYFGSVTVLYTKHPPLCWGSETIGYYMAAKTAVAGIGIVFTFKVLTRYINETLIVIIGCLFFIVSDLLSRFARTTVDMFLSCIPAFFITVAPPGIRSIASKLVKKQEEGALCSILAVTEVIAQLLAPLTINTLYPVGLNQLHLAGFVFFVEAGLLLIPIILFALIHYLFLNNDNFMYDSLVHCSEEANERSQSA